MALTFEQIEQYGRSVSGNVMRIGFTMYWSQGDGRSGFIRDTAEYDNPGAGVSGSFWTLAVNARELASQQMASFDDRTRTLDQAGQRYRQLFDRFPAATDRCALVIRPGLATGKIKVSMTALRWTNVPDTIEMSAYPGTGIYCGLGAPIGQSAAKALYVLSFNSVDWYAN